MPRRGPTEISAGGVVAREDASGWQVCLVRAGRHWGFPKGHVERGESVPAAALREISEECGLDVGMLSIAAELRPSEYAYQRNGRLIFKLVHQFLVLAPAGAAVQAQAGEIDEVAWLPLAEAAERSSFPAVGTALREAEVHLRNRRSADPPAPAQGEGAAHP